jgi:predicted NodU family carbamoyl transferase
VRLSEERWSEGSENTENSPRLFASSQILIRPFGCSGEDAPELSADTCPQLLAGVVTLNCVANGRSYGDSRFDRVRIQPTAGDVRGTTGAAFDTHYRF